MKSYVQSPETTKQELMEMVPVNSCTGQLTAHFELYKRIYHLEGNIVNCGAFSAEHFISFAMLRSIFECVVTKKLITFEKHHKSLYFDHTQLPNGSLFYKTEMDSFDAGVVQLSLLQQGISVCNEFVQGHVSEAIPEYLIENPELKITFLTINLDDYEGTMTALQFFYPRLVAGGILVFDNFHKNEEDYKAICDYFIYEDVWINGYGENGLPHFIVKG